MFLEKLYLGFHVDSGIDLFVISLVRAYSTNGKRQVMGFFQREDCELEILYLVKINFYRKTAYKVVGEVDLASA